MLFIRKGFAHATCTHLALRTLLCSYMYERPQMVVCLSGLADSDLRLTIAWGTAIYKQYENTKCTQ